MQVPMLPAAGTAEVADGIFAILIPLPGNPLKCLNSYVIRGRKPGERSLLVDTGFRQPECRAALTDGLRTLGIEMEETDIFLTHLHADHTGLAPELASPSTRIFIGEHDLSHMPGPESAFTWEDSDRRFAAEGFPEQLLHRLTGENPAQASCAEPYDGYLPVRHGTRFDYGGYSFTALHTPGHTPGHMILWEEAHGIALLGDHVLFDITPNISRWMDREDSLGDYLDSLRMADALPVILPLPAHRQVHMDYHARCRQLLAHHERRCGEVLDILRAESPLDGWTAASRMTWRIRAACWDDFPNAQKWFAVGEALAHLDHLIALGRVKREEKDGRFFYSAL